jgi:hypothetical protein
MLMAALLVRTVTLSLWVIALSPCKGRRLGGWLWHEHALTPFCMSHHVSIKYKIIQDTKNKVKSPRA